LWIVGEIPRNVGPTQEEIRHLTGGTGGDEHLVYFCPSNCRDWALENWKRIIPYAKNIFLVWARENNDVKFLEVEKGVDCQYG